MAPEHRDEEPALLQLAEMYQRIRSTMAKNDDRQDLLQALVQEMENLQLPQDSIAQWKTTLLCGAAPKDITQRTAYAYIMTALGYHNPGNARGKRRMPCDTVAHYMGRSVPPATDFPKQRRQVHALLYQAAELDITIAALLWTPEEVQTFLRHIADHGCPPKDELILLHLCNPKNEHLLQQYGFARSDFEKHINTGKPLIEQIMQAIRKDTRLRTSVIPDANIARHLLHSYGTTGFTHKNGRQYVDEKQLEQDILHLIPTARRRISFEDTSNETPLRPPYSVNGKQD